MGEQRQKELDHRELAGQPSQAGDQFDRVLDAALAKYAAVEPRAGLEERVLANLHAEQNRAPGRAWQRWGIALAAMAVIVAAATLAFRTRKPPPPVIAKTPSTTASPTKPPRQLANRAETVVPHAHSPRRKVTRHWAQHEGVLAAVPKLDQFPSPRPLSEQERMLASYVANDPQRAALIAEARMEALRKDQEEKLREAAQDSNGDSQQ